MDYKRELLNQPDRGNWELHHSGNIFWTIWFRKTDPRKYSTPHRRETNHTEVCSNKVVLQHMDKPRSIFPPARAPRGGWPNFTLPINWWGSPRSRCWRSGEPGHPRCLCFWVYFKLSDVQEFSRNLSLETSSVPFPSIKLAWMLSQALHFSPPSRCLTCHFIWGETDAVTEIFLIFFGTDVLVYNRDFLAGLLLKKR